MECAKTAVFQLPTQCPMHGTTPQGSSTGHSLNHLPAQMLQVVSTGAYS